MDGTARRFVDTDLSGSTFEDVDLSRSRMRSVNLTGAELRAVWLHDVTMRGVEIAHADIYGEIVDVRINGVEVGPLIEAELDQRYPDRAAMRPSDPEGFRHAWDVVERLWAGTVERARGLDPDLLHCSVGGEWSFVETLRHLAFATDSWVSRAILGVESPWHPLVLPWDEMPDTPGIPRDRDARPDLDEVLALRHDRMAVVRSYVDRLDETTLAGTTTPLASGSWPPPQAFPVRECLLIVLNEEWEHRLYAERDLDALTGAP